MAVRSRVRPWVATGVVVAAVGLWATELVLAAADGHPAEGLPGLGGVAFAVVGALVLAQRPGHSLGPLLCGGGLALLLGGASGEYAVRALTRAPGSLPSGPFAAWLSDTMIIPVVGVLVGLLPQETGHPHDGGRADPRSVVDVAIAEVGPVEQARDVPALGQRADLGRRAQVGQETAHIRRVARHQQRLAQVVGQLGKVSARGHFCYNVIEQWHASRLRLPAVQPRA